jgi:hypothetical protein
VVAGGSLDHIWLDVPGYATAAELTDAFQRQLGAAWTDVLDAADPSFAYNAANDAYLAVRDLRPVEHTTLDQLQQAMGHTAAASLLVS